MRMGLNAPSSGKYNNRYKDSNGAWIRSEIWACLAPGHPEIAVKYAIEDACTDHADEGVYAEVFTAALESAAFVENDKFKLIDIALSYIPQDCGCAGAVRKIVELYKSGIDWKQTRVELLNAYPDSFAGRGANDPQVKNGSWGYDAPSNLALTLIGWLYAGDDFGKAICITAGCGEDGDCTTAALGAILGILMGAKGIPEKWKAPVGEEIKTICLNNFISFINIPNNMDELVGRVANLAPAFIGQYTDVCTDNGELFRVFEGEELFCKPELVIDDANGFEKRCFSDSITTGHVFRGSSPLLDVFIRAKNGIDVAHESTVDLDILINNVFDHTSVPLNVEIRWLLPDGFEIVGGNRYNVFVNHKFYGSGRHMHTVSININTVSEPVNNLVCELTVRGFASKIYIPVTLIVSR